MAAAARRAGAAAATTPNAAVMRRGGRPVGVSIGSCRAGASAASAAAAPPTPAAATATRGTPAGNPVVGAPRTVSIWRREGRGRHMRAEVAFRAGDVVLQESPLVAVAPPDPAVGCCDHCFRALPAGGGGGVPCPGAPACGVRYCSGACAAAAAASGAHRVVCGHTRALDDHCAEVGSKFPRVAAGMLARACAEGDRFDVYWSAVHNLVGMRLPPDTDMLPPAWVSGHAAFASAFRGAMSPADHDTFFATVFNLRAYATLMGYLRLNSFAVRCPLGAASPAAAAPSSPAATPVNVTPPAAPAGGCASSSSSSSGDGGSSCSDGSADSSCGSSSCSSGSVAVNERPHDGTALYAVTSFVTHDCGPLAPFLAPTRLAPAPPHPRDTHTTYRCRPQPGRCHGPHGGGTGARMPV